MDDHDTSTESRRPERAVATAIGGTPARTRRLRAQGRETMRRLLEAAISSFGARGYHGTRVDDIVSEAGTSHGTFYLYFSSKEDIFRALIADTTEEMRTLAESLGEVPPTRAGYDQLREWLAGFYDLYVHYLPVIQTWTETNTSNADFARTGMLVLRRFIDQLVMRVEEIAPPPVSDPRTAALAMVSMIERSTFYAAIGLVPVEREDLVDNLASILHVGLFGGARRRRL